MTARTGVPHIYSGADFRNVDLNAILSMSRGLALSIKSPTQVDAIAGSSWARRGRILSPCTRRPTLGALVRKGCAYQLGHEWALTSVGLLVLDHLTLTDLEH
jgi:hypothetical protein